MISAGFTRVQRRHTTTEGATMAEDRGRDLHTRYYAYLLDRVRADKYPSTAMLAMIEQGGNEQERAELVDVLMEKTEQDRFPSIPMLQRMGRIAR
jgi:hypothetical protein